MAAYATSEMVGNSAPAQVVVTYLQGWVTKLVFVLYSFFSLFFLKKNKEDTAFSYPFGHILSYERPPR